MERKLIADMHCPYCAGTFKVVNECQGDEKRIRYGLLECRCFQFPIVDGVLLLSLSKGYGGAEEVLQPYVPLQVAAIQHLQKNDVPGLLAWIRRHIPMAADLIERKTGPYLPFYARMEHELEIAKLEFLADSLKHEVVGEKRSLFALRLWSRKLNLRKTNLGNLLNTYFMSRFFSPRVNTLAVQLGHLPLDGRILSLCCGQGVFENLLAADGRNKDLTCVDGQFLNLLITRNYIAPQGSYICHDVQFPLPFNDGTFDGVFSSTCLPEIPAQRTFAREAIRATSDSGWTFFDSVWGTANKVKRINPIRYYRFCQNFFPNISDYVAFFESCVTPGREVAIDVPATSDQYYDKPRWVSGDARLPEIAKNNDPQISTLITNPKHFKGFTTPSRPWLNADHLAVSPVYDSAREAGGIRLQRRARFDQYTVEFAAQTFPGFPKDALLDPAKANDPAWLKQQFDAGLLAILPKQFDDAAQRLR